MLNPNVILVPIPCPCGQHKSLPDDYGPRELMVSTYCKLAGDACLTALISFFDGPADLDWYGCIAAQDAFRALEDGGFLDVALSLHQDKTAEEALAMARALREAAATIVAKGGSACGARYIRAVARWYDIIWRLGCGAKVPSYPRS